MFRVRGVLALSLLDDGPDVITVYPSVWSADEDGNHAWRPSGTGIVVRARVQPISSTEQAGTGQQVVTLVRVIARNVPAGPWDHVDYDGRTWDVLGEPDHRGDSLATAHTTLTMQARGAGRREGDGGDEHG